eukprot:7340030-Prymnesium_polylepis.1
MRKANGIPSVHSEGQGGSRENVSNRQSLRHDQRQAAQHDKDGSPQQTPTFGRTARHPRAADTRSPPR